MRNISSELSNLPDQRVAKRDGHEQNADDLPSGRRHAIRPAAITVLQLGLLRAHRVQGYMVLEVSQHAVCGVQHYTNVVVLPHLRKLLQRIQIQAQQKNRTCSRTEKQIPRVLQLHHMECIRDHLVRQGRAYLLQSSCHIDQQR